MLYVTNLLPSKRTETWKYDEHAYLVADTPEELEEARYFLALKPAWIQDKGTPSEHFDIVPTKHRKLIRQWVPKGKCEEITRHRLAEIIQAKSETMGYE